MTVFGILIRRTAPRLLGAMLMLAVAGSVSEAVADRCMLAPEHAGMAFPVGQLTEEWACRLKPVIDHYTTANRVGPMKTAMDQVMYFHLLDRPPLAAALINRLDLADYKAEMLGPGRWWGNDGEGSEGIVHLVHHDPTTRIYYLEGTHRSRLLPNLRGKAVVFLRMGVVKDADGLEAMESTMVAYTMLENQILSGLASLLRPLIGATVTRKLAKGAEVVNRLGLEMRQRPDRVLFEASDPPPLADEDVAYLTEALGTRRHTPVTDRSGRATP
jgi:hypothetical protein